MSRRRFPCAQMAGYGLLMLAVLVAGGCSKTDSQNQSGSDPITETENDLGQTSDTDPNGPTVTDAATTINDGELHPEVTIKTSMGDIRVQLDTEKAPVTANNFLDNYVTRGHYNGTIFHYVDPGRTVMGGGYSENLELKDVRAPITSEADNGLENRRGTIAMTRSPDHAHSATSQFFFNLTDNSKFDHIGRDSPDDFGYCVFGKVLSGMDVLDKIGQVEVHDAPDFPSCPKSPVLILSVQNVP